MRAGGVCAEGEDVRGAADIEELAVDGAGGEHAGAAIHEAGHHGCAGTEAEGGGGGGGDVAGDDIGIEDLREDGGIDVVSGAELRAPAGEGEGVVEAGEGGV